MERRPGFWVAYACLGLVVAAALAALPLLALDHVRTVTVTRPADPIGSVKDARSHVGGKTVAGKELGLPDTCEGHVVKGGIVVICNQ